MMKEAQIEAGLIANLSGLTYSYRPDIRDRETPGRNFREKFEALNRVKLRDAGFAVSACAQTQQKPAPLGAQA